MIIYIFSILPYFHIVYKYVYIHLFCHFAPNTHIICYPSLCATPEWMLHTIRCAVPLLFTYLLTFMYFINNSNWYCWFNSYYSTSTNLTLGHTFTGDGNSFVFIALFIFCFHISLSVRLVGWLFEPFPQKAL